MKYLQDTRSLITPPYGTGNQSFNVVVLRSGKID
jgi:hypothetical protein